jgi:hypothetical protein
MEIPALIFDVKGYLAEDEGLRLFELALETAPLGPCLEIGGFCGKSTVYLGTACKQRGRILFSIDHHRGSEIQQPGQPYYDPELLDKKSGLIDSFPYFRATIEKAGLEGTVVPIVAKSCTVAQDSSTGGTAMKRLSQTTEAGLLTCFPAGSWSFMTSFSTLRRVGRLRMKFTSLLYPQGCLKSCQ